MRHCHIQPGFFLCRVAWWLWSFGLLQNPEWLSLVGPFVGHGRNVEGGGRREREEGAISKCGFPGPIFLSLDSLFGIKKSNLNIQWIDPTYFFSKDSCTLLKCIDFPKHGPPCFLPFEARSKKQSGPREASFRFLGKRKWAPCTFEDQGPFRAGGCAVCVCGECHGVSDVC